jgi:hypothetical protein
LTENAVVVAFKSAKFFAICELGVEFMSDMFSLPEDVLKALVAKVTQSFLEGAISQEEAASRLVGTGRFESNDAALNYLKTDVVPQVLQKLALLEDEISALQEQASKLRGLAGLNARPKETRLSKKSAKDVANESNLNHGATESSPN